MGVIPRAAKTFSDLGDVSPPSGFVYFPETLMTCDPKTMRCQILVSLVLSLTLVALWIFYHLPASILPILIFIQWMPIIMKRGPISFLGKTWLLVTVGLLVLGILAGIVRLLLGA
jgi:hypothetical protein